MGHIKLSTDDAIRTIKEALQAAKDKDLPDWTARLKAADMTLKLADAYPRESRQESVKQMPVINITPRDQISDKEYYTIVYLHEHGGEWPSDGQLEQFMAEQRGWKRLPSDSG
jgi:hypothetical protein